FVEFGRNHSEFEKRNVQLIGVSIDSVYSHIAWARNIEQNFNVKIEFPVVADLDQNVAASYGMVHEAVSDTSAVRAVFVIDPKGAIRAVRSEEHTSELQSPCNLVCRLLLEKKNGWLITLKRSPGLLQWRRHARP